MKSIIVYIIFLTLSSNSFAGFDKSKFENITLTMGNWFENFKEVQTDSNGNKDNFEVAPYFSFAMDYKYNPKFTIIPEIGWIVSREAGNSKIKKNLFFTKIDLAYYLKDNIRIRAGTSLMILNITGSGGETALPNGDGQDTYFIPSERRTALNQTLDLGVEYIIDRISVRAGSYIYAFADSQERMITYSTSISYLLPLDEI
jgi:hypothetical protein